MEITSAATVMLRVRAPDSDVEKDTKRIESAKDRAVQILKSLSKVKDCKIRERLLDTSVQELMNALTRIEKYSVSRYVNKERQSRGWGEYFDI